ncbi:restriction endonuclease subunit S [Alkalilimnicola sp. S0819]|uniref:restriction endonuclease subunit S n=1 Tax=Alkalilimnicola sp. S0819 TaxID=2613922 RepID=UPI001262325D|nr:restriction endonuclease subunit S [Alkalilimnicola sp. S0819]KAB7624108.1 hypothetical protein F3N43_06885 [Alkalilimnicola sp. S0819]MPQ16359.1 hypothetical protein [Alkalilimnicola sp. S0819]
MASMLVPDLNEEYPEGWIQAPLGEFIERIDAGKSFKCEERPPEEDEVGVTKVSSVSWGDYQEDQSKTCRNDSFVEPRLFVRDGDFLFSRANTVDLVGACVIARGVTKNVMLSDKILRIVFGDIMPTYVLYFLRSRQGRQQIEALCTGNQESMRNIGQDRIRRISIALPPIAEQRRIVTKIEALFSELDKGVESLTTARAQLKTYRQALLKHAFEGKLTEQWRKDHADELTPVEHVLENMPAVPRPNRWKTRSKDLIVGHSALAVGNPGTQLPDGWCWVPVVDVARMESGHTPSRRHPEWWDGDIPWIGIADARLNDGKVIRATAQQTNEEGLANSAARLLPPGTVCVSRTASVGYVVEMGSAMATSQDFVNWVPTGAVTAAWLRLVFGADRDALRRFGKGSTHTTIYFPEWLSVHIALPPVEEQCQIVQEVEAHLSRLEQMEQTVMNALQRTEALRQSILKRAFEGRLVPQDPNDEPAAELLARIRQETAKQPRSNRHKPKAEASP